MKNTQLGFFTSSSLIASVLTILIIVGFAVASGGMLFSPGSLNAQPGVPLGNVTSHAEIGGQCKLCHAPFWGNTSMADNCLECHTDIADQLLTRAPLHGTLYTISPNLLCQNCHPDHRGSEAALTDLSRVGFSHNTFGFLLTAHKVKSDGSPFDCKDCHALGYVSYDQQNCSSCHARINLKFEGIHVQDFGNDCLACHDGVDTYNKNFDHNKVSFQLTGNHAQILCGACHLNDRTPADLKSTPQDCISCHSPSDVHWGRLGADCGSCHGTNGWTSAAFDHNLAAFRLTGKHTSIGCTDCHVNHILQGTPTACVSCHEKTDVHQGRLGTDCGSCHSTYAWTPAAFDHNLAVFKLTGKHITTPCQDCHVNQVLQGTPVDCYACHAVQDKHNGQYGTSCGLCHSTTAWLPATVDHSRFGFPLTGAHAVINCLQCHSGGSFGGLSTACAACHAEPAGHYGTDCAQCHSTSNWNATFNHPNACGEGGCLHHHGATCANCHPSGKFSASDCRVCHSNNPGD